jgi:hypothetical protein
MSLIVLNSAGCPLHALYVGGLLLSPSCFSKELEHRRGAKERRLNK